MIEILENGQVLQQDKGDTYEQWLPIGMEIEAEINVDKTEVEVGEIINVTLQWTRINLETESWEEDTTIEESFNLQGGEQSFIVTPTNGMGSQEVTFDAPGIYTIRVYNLGKGGASIQITVTQ